MPEYPGVYVEETGGNPREIDGVSTSTAGFVGETEFGPTAPTLVTSWAEYQRVFGGSTDLPPLSLARHSLPYAARGYFENGGQRLYVARAVASAGAAADLDAYIGADPDPAQRTGLEALMTVPEVSLMAIPDEMADARLAHALLDRCEAARDRFAVLAEPTDGAELQAIGRHRDSSYGACYYPRIRVASPHRVERSIFVTPVGHVCGIYARVDGERGVHKAPANEVVRGIVDGDGTLGTAPLSHLVRGRDLGTLNRRGVNVIRDLRASGQAIRVWGARTMSTDPEWKYVNVRRLVIFIEQSIQRGTKWAVFEPPTEPTWSAVRTEIQTFLQKIWRNGALMGSTPDQAYFVKCDRTTMTQDDIDNGRLVITVGVAPLRPSEFVIIRIGHWADADP